MILKIPSIIAWRQDDDLVIYHPPPSINAAVQSNPVRWTLRRLLGREFSTGRGLFFTKPRDIDAYSKVMPGESIIPPFFVWPKLHKIFTSDLRKTKETMYYLGEFEIETGSPYKLVQEKRFKDIHLRWLQNLFLFNGHDENEQDEHQIEQNVDYLWQRIFELVGQFHKANFYWFEDNTLPLGDLGLKLYELDDCEINIYQVGENLNASAKISFGGLQSDFAGIGELVNSSSFNIFIVDIMSEWHERKSGRQIELLGAEIVRAIRENESGKNSMKNLIIVFTGGYSPFVMARAKALKADLIVFKQTGSGRQETGLHRQGTTTEGQFLLLWSIYWPLSVLKYLNVRLTEIAEIDPNSEVEALKILYDEITKICPEGVFYFWQDWLREVKQLLQKWRSILLIEGAYITDEDTKNYRNEIKELISKAGFKRDAD